MFWKEPLVLFKYGFDYSIKKYFIDYFKYMAIVLAEFIIIRLISTFIGLIGLSEIAVKAILVMVIPNIITVFLFHKTDEYIYTVSLVKKVMRRKGS